MRCECCDRSMEGDEIQYLPDSLTLDYCAVCVDIAMDAAYSDGFIRPDDEVTELGEGSGEVPVLDTSFDVEETGGYPSFSGYRYLDDGC
jgi:hypothetical protein